MLLGMGLLIFYCFRHEYGPSCRHGVKPPTLTHCGHGCCGLIREQMRLGILCRKKDMAVLFSSRETPTKFYKVLLKDSPNVATLQGCFDGIGKKKEFEPWDWLLKWNHFRLLGFGLLVMYQYVIGFYAKKKTKTKTEELLETTLQRK